MLNELSNLEYKRVKPLFSSLKQHCFCAGVINGIYPGKVYVDNLRSPATALMITRGTWAYLAGDADNQAYNRAVNQALFSGDLLGQDTQSVILTSTNEFQDRALQTIFDPLLPIPMPRLYHTLSKLDDSLQFRVPEGFQIRRIERDLLELGSELPDDVHKMIMVWEEGQDPDRTGLGFVAISDGKVVAHAVIDCIVDGFGEIGLETSPQFQRRGLATAVSRATLDYGFTHGLDTVIWDCYEHNIPSVRLAQKLGFQLQQRYFMHLLIFDEPLRSLNQAWISFECKQYQQAIRVCEHFIAGNEKPQRSFSFLLGCSYAGLGDHELALSHLKSAVDLGWDSIIDLENTAELEVLHEYPQWELILQQARGNG